MIKNKKILIVDLILLGFLVLAVVSLMLSFSHEEEVSLSPGTLVLFTIAIPDDNSVVVDDNLDFLTPRRIILEDKLVLELKEGTHYFKFTVNEKEDIRRFTVNAKEVRLMFLLNTLKEEYEVVSVSNKELKVVVNQYGVRESEAILGNSDLDYSNRKIIGGNNG